MSCLVEVWGVCCRGRRCHIVTSSLSVQSLKKKLPITDGVYSVMVVRYV